MISASKETCVRNGGTTSSCKVCDTIQRNALTQLDVLDFLRCFENSSVDGFVTDSPYNWKFMGAKWDDIGSNEKYYTWAKAWGQEMYRSLKEGGSVLAFGGKRTYHWLAQALKDAGFQHHDTHLWVFWSGFPKGKYNLKPASEVIFHGVKNPSNKPLADLGVTFNPDAIRVPQGKDGLYPVNVFDIPKASKREKTAGKRVENKHPTVKPIKLLTKLIALTTNPGDVVVDPFVGSGSTAVAAKTLCRDFIGNDLNDVGTARQRVDLTPSDCNR